MPKKPYPTTENVNLSDYDIFSPFLSYIEITDVDGKFEEKNGNSFTNEIQRSLNGTGERIAVIETIDGQTTKLFVTSKIPGNPDNLMQDLRAKYDDSIECVYMSAEILENICQKAQGISDPDAPPTPHGFS